MLRLSSILVALALLGQGCAYIQAPAPINSPVFVRRPPPPGGPGYLQTIKYINDGLQYLEPWAGFEVSPHGDLCFRGATEVTVRRLANYRDFWCMPPTAVANVEALDDDVTHVPAVRLWCRHSAPYCAWRADSVGGSPINIAYGWSDTITFQAIPYKREKAAIEYLIGMMGGALQPTLTSGLDSDPFETSVRGPTNLWEEPR